MRPLYILGFLLALIISPALFGAQPDGGNKQEDTSSERMADSLARSVVDTVGRPQDVRKIEFDFVVRSGGEEHKRRTYQWWPKEGRVVAEFDGSRVDLRRLDDYNLSKMARSPEKYRGKWSEVADTEDVRLAADAWGHFVNDSYWLFAPAKLFDPGVRRSRAGPNTLELSFEEVGLTPGDRYTLTIDPERSLVVRWGFELQSGQTGAFSWKDYEKFGPLLLSTRRVSQNRDSKLVIQFENIRVVED